MRAGAGVGAVVPQRGGQAGPDKKARRHRRRRRAPAVAGPGAGDPRQGEGGHRGAPRRHPPAGGLPARQRARSRTGRGAVQAGRAVLGGIEGGLPGEDGALSGGGDRLPRRAASTCPRVPRRPPTVDLARAQSVYDRLITRVPALPQDRHGHLPLRLLAARPGQAGRGDQVLPDASSTASRARVTSPTPGWPSPSTASTSSRTTRARSRPTRRCSSTPSRSSTTWRCSRPPGATGSWATPPRAPCASRTSSIWPRRRPARPTPSRSAPPSCRGRRSTTWSSCSPRTTPRPRGDAFEFLAQIGGKEYSQKVLRQLADTVFDQTRYERAIEAYRLLITLDPNGGDAPDSPPAHRRVAYQLLGDIKTAPSPRCASWPTPTARAAPGPRPTRTGRRPWSTRARWPRS